MDKIYELPEKNYIVPARLREARQARLYTLSEVATLVGVSAQAVSQYELGTNKPSIAVLNKLSTVLDVPITFFQKPYEKENYASSAVYYRSTKNTPKKMKEACRTRIHWVNEIYRFTQNYIDYPVCNLPDVSRFLKDDLEDEDIEIIAAYVRECWGLGKGPIVDLVSVLQSKGIVISRTEIGTKKVDAYSAWYGGVPYIILGSDKQSACRSRFDLAHELGHLLLHTNIEDDDLKSSEIQDKIEKQAHYFAGAFLLPRETFSKDLISTSMEQFKFLKAKWKVSIAAMAKRARNLGIITENQERYVYITLNKMGGKKKEPLDDQIPFEKPYLFKQAFSLLLKNRIFTKESLVEELALSRKELESLLFLPSEILGEEVKEVVQPKLKLIKFSPS